MKELITQPRRPIGMKLTTAALGSTVALTMAACWPYGPQACTDVGGLEGVVITVPQELVVGRARVHVEVCSDERCVSDTARLGRPPIGGGTDHPRDAWFSPGKLAALLEQDEVTVTTEIRSKGDLVARRTSDEPVARHWPNGRECDGDGFASVTVAIGAEDLVAETLRGAAPRPR